MSSVSITCRRTFGRLRNLRSTVLALCAFLSASTALLAFRLTAAEGGLMMLPACWTLAVSQVLPFLSVLLGMDVWSEERSSGRLETLLSVSVRERDYTLGKFLAVWVFTLLGVGLEFVLSISLLANLAPQALPDSFVGFLPGLFALSLHAALWSAVTVMVSALFRRGAAAGVAGIILIVARPRGIWAALMAWSPQGAMTFGENPIDAHVIDMTCGAISPAMVVSCAALALLALFAASKVISMHRLAGSGARKARLAVCVSVVLAAVFASLFVVLSHRLDSPIDLAVDSSRAAFSPRMHRLLSELDGEVSVTCFLPRRDARFRSVNRFLRSLKRESLAAGGQVIAMRFVDPKWDFGAAERLFRLGAPEASLVVEKGRRHSIVSLDGGLGERPLLTALQNVCLPPQRRNVYWTFGHGEGDFNEYGPRGFSDIARELTRSGYRNARLDLSLDGVIPSDCAMIVVAGAKDEFSRVELGRLDAYLKRGGRLLVLVGGPGKGGVTSLLPSWGIRPVVRALAGVQTLSGSDVIVSEFSEHAIAAPLVGSRIVMERPVVLMPSSAVEGGSGADRIGFSPVATVGRETVVAAVERGAGTGNDLQIRPTRIVVIGDHTFVMNGELTARANANRDLFANAVSYLSGSEILGASGLETGIFTAGMDRLARRRFVLLGSVVLPGGLLVILLFVGFLRRRTA